MEAPKKTRKARKRMTADERARMQLKREQTRFRTGVHEIFQKSGFEFIPSEDKHFTLKTANDGERTTELDGVYITENIIVIVEDTHRNPAKEHLAKKRLFAELATKHTTTLVETFKEHLPDFDNYFNKKNYSEEDYVIRYTYFSMYPIGMEHIEAANRAGIIVVERPLANYFSALVKTIAKSAKYEILKFLKIEYSEIGMARVSGRGAGTDSKYHGFLLPERNSTYPDGYKVISFYADPSSLLKKSYVLRKNSWTDPDKSYQRIIDTKKIRLMRKYLCESKRVYVNNIIATLPSETNIQEFKSTPKEGKPRQLAPDELKKVKPVTITLPDEFNVVGLIDGQHRVFSYHEGYDIHENDISKLRDCQNLLVTGIIYPEEVTEDERIQFEAKLFLEINDRQTKVKSALTQEIELIVNPYSTTAVARAVIAKLARNGPLKDRLEEHVFDDAKKLKISSIVSYGLKPLIKRDGDDSLYSVWDEPKLKEEISKQPKNKAALNKYIDFCHVEINKILQAAMESNPSQWHIDHESKMLTPTSINGLIRCLRLIIENEDNMSLETYRDRLKRFGDFDFNQFKSSHWNLMGTSIYEKYFS
ncbi:DGQHR domain-containing protein [Pseudomonas aeruginosa]|uniref:DGQHR domain-containing protein n=1 Tax=Pseudomonas aeruginosa TaxID=287 RepID=UPI000FC41618|nr:DGQHR domain-containing protein [Pseudomonas aeruginosa]ELK4741073.1 DGQHR domain-containing protein [Pseudomonas aeruginosa]ELP2753085.1 DGQHR domain-containing protein [Pseudomonas aeruginosa]KAB5405553.1 DGQHR domain-containing protein [Pseudomonas aeruginosa]MBG4769541.1 DGQHR domain-containing protein [Pseudomonas aeruginosa]MBG4821619.1 DGQHR domain-containing protein [Pseudomonas aeruginosa]